MQLILLQIKREETKKHEERKTKIGKIKNDQKPK